MYICLCRGLTESAVREVVESVEGDADALLTLFGWEEDDFGPCS